MATREFIIHMNDWNMDETGWKDIQCSGRIIAKRGEESVHVDVNGDLKAQVTAVCTISKSGRKLAPIYILRGETERAVAEFEAQIGPGRSTYTTNSWMDTTTMLQFLSYLHQASNELPCGLVMDSFGAHFPDAVSDKARALGIRVIPVPKGLTGQWQPLDRRCFGPLKRISQALWKDVNARNPHMRWNHLEAARLLEQAWDSLKHEIVLSAWEFLGGDDPQVDDESDDEPEEGHHSREADPPFTFQDFRRAQEFDTDTEPGSDGALLAQAHHVDTMIELSHERTAAHRPEADKVLQVDTGVPFHQLPVLEGVPLETTDANANARHWHGLPGHHLAKPSPGTRLPDAFPAPDACPFDQPRPPIDKDGWAFPQGPFGRAWGTSGERYWPNVPFV
jgi:hypothetical protein